jgi:hypothetical protein
MYHAVWRGDDAQEGPSRKSGLRLGDCSCAFERKLAGVFIIQLSVALILFLPNGKPQDHVRLPVGLLVQIDGLHMKLM